MNIFKPRSHIVASQLKQPESMIDILIVEDDPRHSGLIELFLKEVDEYNVIGTASTGGEAVRLLLEREPDAIILDLRLEEGDGLKVMKMIHGLNIRTPVILSTAVTDEEIIEELKRLGADDYLLKPYSSEALLDSIEQHAVVP